MPWGRWDSWICRAPGGSPPAPPDPRMGAGKLLLSSLPSSSSSSSGSLQGPPGSPQSCCSGTIPISRSGDPFVPGAGRGGCGRKSGKDGALPGREEQDPAKPFLVVFLTSSPYFQHPFFFLFFCWCHNKTLVSLRCFPLAPDRLSSADSPFSQLLLYYY